ncbi:PAS domain-containing protein [Botryobacter ruber]|uniref:PAS domain-containing protein n=1 Tax=Botryobacter ruber TaxID=2171629 RepID=UPI0013E32E16|nr:PAS domain-containing protein [Botryobacter ruber]
MMEHLPVQKLKINYGQLFKALPGLCVLLSPDQVILDATDSFLKRTSTSREIIGRHFFEVFPEANAGAESGSKEILTKAWHDALKNQTAYNIPGLRYDLPKPDGSGYAECYWHISGKPLTDEEGQVTCVLHELQDVTEQHLAATEQKRLLLLAGAAGGIVWEWDIPNKTLTFSDAYKDSFGYAVKDHKGKYNAWKKLVHPDDLKQTLQSLKAVLAAGGKFWAGEYRYKKADGTYTSVIDHGYVMYDEENNPLRMIGSMIELDGKREIIENNERFARIAKATSDVIWDWNLQENSIWWNDGFQELFGYRNEDTEASIHFWENCIHPDDFEPTVRSVYQVIEDGQTNWEAKYRFRCADGSYMLIHDKGYVIEDDAGNPVRMIGAMVDITEKARIEQELQESISHARKILDSLPLMIWTASPGGHVTYYNQRWFEYTGATSGELSDRGWEKFIHPDDLESSETTWRQALQEGEPFVNQSRWRSAHDGSYRWFLGRGVPIFDNEGRISLWVGSHTDIEDQKRMMGALEESTRKFRFLAESIPQIVWTTDGQGYHDYFNQRWTDYTGLSLEDSLGTTWRHVLHPDDRKRTSERWKHSLRTGEYYEIEYRFRNGKDDSYRWFLGQAMPMRDEHGNIIKWFGTCTDIEDHKKAEEELQEKNLELERINYDLDSFVYTASHDLKLPIINMAGIFQELTRSAAFTDPEAQIMIEMFNRSLDQIQSTITDLSEVVRVQKSKVRDVEQVDLEELTENIKVSIQDSLTDSGASIYTDFSSVPVITFSRVNLKSILYNLVSNAIKYRDHTRPPEIYLSTARSGDYVELRVQDNGLGIDMDRHQNKLFKMFKRFHNHVNGSGLGLYIVNRLLTNNGGYINVESKLNEGTTFYLYFKQKEA